ncbi:glycosyltransferase family 1 protein [Leptolyngbya sp. FACHB-17]|uniref:glycosyltransferase family 4 protein n=1 Tax=unclassified Leptolyngbya TaxID=2650499 RepID=UPI0016800C32|nr:glycosyltransferase family 1 protein [Leptolyngbya sp. FACHB-17]MBD2081729.1 glycosyltransferase family 4 protein [Leptolyngbya sp. FACHB-17]
MKVGFDARHLRANSLRGMDRYTIELIKELTRLGVGVTLFHREREPLNLAHVQGFDCRVVGLSDYCGLHWEQVAVPMALAQGKFDLYHAPAERGVPLLAPCPVVFTVHSVTAHSYYHFVQQGFLPGTVADYLGYDFQPNAIDFWKVLFKLQLRKARHILAPSDFCRSELLQFLGLSPDKVTTTHLATSDSFQHDQQSKMLLGRLNINQPYILYVGGYEPHKNVSGLLKVFALVKQHCPEVMLVVVGTQFPFKQLQQEAIALGLTLDQDVLFLVDLGDELVALYRNAELFVSLSWRETFCLPALEALTCGTPAIGSKFGAFPEVTGEAGITIDPRDLQATAETIVQKLRIQLKEQVLETAYQQSQKFSWTETAKKTLGIYQKLLAH